MTQIAKMYYINLDRCTDRRALMESAFGSSVTRVSAIDGMKYSDGTYDDMGRPRWGESYPEKLVEEGILHPMFENYKSGWFASEVGCALSHMKAWRIFLETGIEYGIFFEDDVMPTPDMKGKDIAQEILSRPELEYSDILFLVGEAYWRPIRLFRDGRVKGLRNMMGYIVSRETAEYLLENVLPLTHAIDVQVAFRFFESMQRPAVIRRMPPDLPEVRFLSAYGLKKDPAIMASEFAAVSTFTLNGEKSWMDPEFRPPRV